MYARHGREPFGPEIKAEGLMGCPFDPVQGKESPLYVNPVMSRDMTEILAEGKGVAARHCLKEAPGQKL